MTTIPVSQVVSVLPNVLAVGGTGLVLNGLLLTGGTRVPIGTVKNFASSTAVANFFGAGSTEALAAAIYFAGYVGATLSPGSILFAQYNVNAVAAYLQSGNISAVGLTAVQGMSGTLTLTVDGTLRSNGAVNLSGAASLSAAAGLIQTALNTGLPALASFNGSIAVNVLTVGTLTSGTISVGNTIAGIGVIAGTQVLVQLTGTIGGVGTYTVSNSQTVAAEAMTATPANVAVTFDSISGSFFITSGITGVGSTIGFATGNLAASLLMTAATGGVLSQGAAPATPTPFMNGVIKATQNWATFMLIFNPDATGNATKLAFAQWAAGQNSRYAFICGDTDVTPTQSTNAPASLGQLILAANYGGTSLIYDPTVYQIAAFICGATAAINFNRVNARVTFAFLSSSAGVTPSVSDLTTATNLIANGYNYYGAYATANQSFQFFYNGSVSGAFAFLDSYINQIWLNSQLQLALITFLTSIGAIPYNIAGYGMIENALYSTIIAGLTFGAYSPGVILSSSQVTQVNNQAGVVVAPTLQQQGWYLQVLDPGPTVRAARGSPIVNFWYCDGEAVQQITLISTEVQ